MVQQAVSEARRMKYAFLIEKARERFSGGKVKKEIFDRCELLLIPLDI